jgi:hypothetical protein
MIFGWNFMLQIWAQGTYFFYLMWQLMTWHAVDIFRSKGRKQHFKHWSTSALTFSPWLFSESRELSTTHVYIREIFHFTELNCIRFTSISSEPWPKQFGVAVFRKSSTQFLFNLPLFLIFSLHFVMYFKLKAGWIMHADRQIDRPTPPPSKLLFIHLSLWFPEV